jgi:hypothetical protein
MAYASRQVNRRQRRATRWLVMPILAAIAAILVIGFFRTLQTEIAERTAKSSKPQSDDEIYSGSILFPSDNGIVCHQLFFDNRTGQFKDNGQVNCEEAYYRGRTLPPVRWSTARAQVISEGFRRRTAGQASSP